MRGLVPDQDAIVSPEHLAIPAPARKPRINARHQTVDRIILVIEPDGAGPCAVSGSYGERLDFGEVIDRAAVRLDPHGPEEGDVRTTIPSGEIGIDILEHALAAGVLGPNLVEPCDFICL